MIDNHRRILDILAFLYGKEQSLRLAEQVRHKIDRFRAGHLAEPFYDPAFRVDENDVIMIAYGDMVQSEGEKPLTTLKHFAMKKLKDVVNTIHILPFFPYSSDDGFSVIDYLQVKPEWGDWDSVAEIASEFDLMFDVVVNHISQFSRWFQAFLAQEEPYQDYFIAVDPSVDLSQVFRPRALPLLTACQTTAGERHVWTTFSADQVDLNFSNPAVLMAMLDVFLFYVAHGARFIRLDAVAFIWKEIGTTCLHLPQVHQIVELIRTVLDETAPQVVLITETNVPHQENISYFGDGHHEAQMVYNFSLPPLVLHSIQTGTTRKLKDWASSLDLPTTEVTFFNFLASHDGIGLLPARGILSDEEIDSLANHALARGGRVSYKNNPDGSTSPYEMNINYLEATRPSGGEETVEQTARRFLATQSVLLALRGVPGIYYHSLLGSENWVEGMLTTGQNRTINREKLRYSELMADLANPYTLRHHVFTGYKALLAVRRAERAFDPHGEQVVLNTPDSIFGLYRRGRKMEQGVFCLANFTNLPVTVSMEPGLFENASREYIDLLSDTHHLLSEGCLSLYLSPYQVIWLKAF